MSFVQQGQRQESTMVQCYFLDFLIYCILKIKFQYKILWPKVERLVDEESKNLYFAIC